MVCGPASAWAIGGIAAAPWVRSTSRKSASAAYLSRIASAITPYVPRASVAWRRSVASPKSLNTTSAASGPAFRSARSPASPCSTTSRSPWVLPPTASTSPAAATCRRYPATVSGRWDCNSSSR